MKALSKIILESNKKAEIAQATGLRKKMDCLDFLCILVLIIEILAPLNIVLKLLQSKNMDLDKVCLLLETGIKEIKSLRNNFDDILAKAKALAIKWNIVPTFKQSQIKRTKKLFDEGGVNFRFETAEHQFKVNVFNKIIDIVTNQIDSRFTSLKTVNSYFSFLNPKNIILLDSDKIFTHATNLQNKYLIDISDAFPNQMVLFKKTFKMELKDVDSILDLLKLITITYCDMSCSFTEIIGALTLYLTLPVSVATAERSFSTLKRIKTHLKTTMAQNRLSALSLLAIEAEEAAKLDLKDVINQFAAMKARKKQFR
ncbi:zinc finger MYM-type protein 1-like [Hydra vulgaris]|uniref:zinc finger MYM-type protein 1-like n=1 Tax=Hydra vulgaris TaxID=6087 RepID=UPI0032EA3E35